MPVTSDTISLHSGSYNMAADSKEGGLPKICRTVVMIFSFLLIIPMGIGCIVVGLWMYADRYVLSYYIVMRRDYSDRALSAGPGLLIAAGIICIVIAFIGFIGLRRDKKQYLLMYAVILLLIMILELVIGFSALVFRNEIHKHLKDGMKESLANQYQFDNEVGKAWNWIQVKRRCCGADGSWDYRDSKWFFEVNKKTRYDLVDPTVFVPITCCVLDFNQDRDPHRVNPQDPRPRDERRCQEDAAGRIDGGTNVHGRGCFSRLLDFINKYINTLICIGCIVGFLQVIGFLAAIYLTCGGGYNNKEHFVTSQQPFVQKQMQREVY